MPTFLLLFGCLWAAISRSVEVVGRELMVDGSVYHVQGICYSPVPVGESPQWVPLGDYFTADYAYIWARDLPLLKAMGVNTLRLYGWNNDRDHTAFLDELSYAGLTAMVTFYVPNGFEADYTSETVREAILANFTKQVKKYGDHPGILAWSFGNELNGDWNQLQNAFNKVGNCKWSPPCWNQPIPTATCKAASRCVYEGLFGFINEACKRAGELVGRPCSSAFADTDQLVQSGDNSRVGWYGDLLPNVGFWAMQLYRGYSFGSYFSDFEKASANYSKPIVVTEYGVDAFNDPCGWQENINNHVCFNLPDDPKGGSKDSPNFVGCTTQPGCKVSGEAGQVMFDQNNAQEMIANYYNNGTKKGAVVGGFLMAWQDESWKGYNTQGWCPAEPCDPRDTSKCNKADYTDGGKAGCTFKAHWTCPNPDGTWHGLCGYFNGGFPDGYVNEEWFGVTHPTSCGFADHYGGHKVDELALRPVFYTMQQLWTGSKKTVTPMGCAALKTCWSCIQAHGGDSDALNGDCATPCGRQATPTLPPTLPVTPTAAPTHPGDDHDVEVHVRINVELTEINQQKQILLSEIADALDLTSDRVQPVNSDPFAPVKGNAGATEVFFILTKAPSPLVAKDNLQATERRLQQEAIKATDAFLNLKYQMSNITAGQHAALADKTLTPKLDFAYGAREVVPEPPVYPTPGPASDNALPLWQYVLIGVAVGIVILMAGFCICRRGSGVEEKLLTDYDDA